ncbi:hypothetical protein FACS1894126_1770 [Alphaproteobacteria bacterium]|nr:hypothetical protein FACS1894126_1770 [Alphaproteobacteria bacterium]
MRSKKFISYFVLTSVMALGAVSADSYVAGAANDVYPSSDADGDGSKESNKDSKKRRDSAFYLLAGIGCSCSDNDLDADVRSKHSSNDPFPGYNMDDFDKEYAPLVAGKGYGTAMATAGADGEIDEVNIVGDSPHVGKSKSNPSGTVGGGYGVRFRNGFSLAGEVTVDLGKSHEVTLENSNEEFTMKSSGIIPSVAIKLGCRVSEWRDTELYVKIGGAFVSTNVQSPVLDDKVKMSEVVPLVGAGIDVALNDSLSLRLECDYRFEGKKNGLVELSDVKINDPENGDIVFSRSVDLKQKTKGWTARAMASLSI